MERVGDKMRMIGRGWVLVGLLLAAALGSPAHGQVGLTTVADTIYTANGAPAQGSVVVSWASFTTAAGTQVAAGSTSATLGSQGALSIALVPNAGATPTGSYYTAIFHLSDGTLNREYWVVPASGSPVKLAVVQNQVLPTSVALQTVSKAYVDQAIAAAVVGGTSGTTTTTTPTYVQKSGDTMTGPLVLPGDPVSALQAADKHYVDASVAAVGGGSATKVSTLPTTSQTVAQPAGTQLEVNALNGVLDATGFVTGNGNNGLGNALGSAFCTSGCEVSISQNYPGTAGVPVSGLAQTTHVVDHRGGAMFEVLQDPLPDMGTSATGSSLTQVTTRTAQQMFALKPSTGLNSIVMSLTHNVLTGGVNQFPADVEAVPYQKSNYGILSLVGNYHTQGQHVQFGSEMNCYAVGDCLAGGQFVRSSGGFRDEADEGAHPFDLQMTEDTRVFQGNCSTGCTPGSTSITVNGTRDGGTQGDGRFLMDLNPNKVISAGTIVGNSAGVLPIVNFSGTSFPVSTQFLTAAAATSQANNLAPGTVTLPIATSGLAADFSGNTAALAAASGVACVADPGAFPNFETAAYRVADTSHLQLTLNKVHASGAMVAVGGLCGYGLEQVADTQVVGSTSIRQIFPVVGSPSANRLYYAPALTPVAGDNDAASTSAFQSTSAAVASASRSGNVVTLNLAQNLPFDVNGYPVTVSGVSDPSYNGTFTVSTVSASTLTYTAAGPDGSSSGGSMSFSNGRFALYPLAEVLSVSNPSSASVDGTFTLAANNVPWAAGDAVEEPHYYQQSTFADMEYITQYVPRPVGYAAAGKFYQGQVGPGVRGWSVFNGVPANNYIGAGGTHHVPYSAFLAAGPWQNSLEVDAGTDAVLRVHCNLNTCSRWDSDYALFALDRNGGVEDFLKFAPQSSTASWILGGTFYTFSPTAFTAANIVSTSFRTGYNGNAQIAPGGSAGYSNFTLNGNNSDGSRLGFIGGGIGDANLYLDVPGGGTFVFRNGSNDGAASLINAGGLRTPGVTAPKLGSGMAANSDLVGVLQVPAGSTTSQSYSFAGSYATTPVCLVQAQNATARGGAGPGRLCGAGEHERPERDCGQCPERCDQLWVHVHRAELRTAPGQKVDWAK